MDIRRFNVITQTAYSLADEIYLRDQIVNQQSHFYPTNSIIIDYHQEFVNLTGREITTPYNGKNYVVINGVVKEIL